MVVRNKMNSETLYRKLTIVNDFINEYETNPHYTDTDRGLTLKAENLEVLYKERSRLEKLSAAHRGKA